jgi:membrane fusion protein (multidrug efflux system)
VLNENATIDIICALFHRDSIMSKTMWGVIILILVVLIGTITFDVIKQKMVSAYMKNFKIPAQTVETIKAKTQTWKPRLYAVGSLKAINGVNVSPEVAGQVIAIRFKSGDTVKKGQSLVQLDDAFDKSKLRNDMAALKLAQVQYMRQEHLIKTGATSQQSLDEANASLAQKKADVSGDRVTISKKNVRAPFSGKIGIRLINLGEYVSAGTALVSLQSMNPLFIDFNLPEQNLNKLHVDQPVKVTIGAYPDKDFEGKIIALNSTVDVDTRNVQVRAEIPNTDGELYPGVFGNVYVILPQDKNVVTIPQTAINYTLYGDSVYIVKQDKDKNGKPVLRAIQQPITLGMQRGDSVEVLKGLKAGQEIVSAGQVKIQNKSEIVVNDTMVIKQGAQPKDGKVY